MAGEEAQTSGLRLMLKRSEIPKLLGQLNQAFVTAKDWKKRASDNLKRIASGSGMSFAPTALPPNGVPSGRFNVTTEVICGVPSVLPVSAIFAV